MLITVIRAYDLFRTMILKKVSSMIHYLTELQALKEYTQSIYLRSGGLSGTGFGGYGSQSGPDSKDGGKGRGLKESVLSSLHLLLTWCFYQLSNSSLAACHFYIAAPVIGNKANPRLLSI